MSNRPPGPACGRVAEDARADTAPVGPAWREQACLHLPDVGIAVRRKPGFVPTLTAVPTWPRRFEKEQCWAAESQQIKITPTMLIPSVRSIASARLL
ncbi:MAG: hypothetical protein JWR32_3377 [Mycobacterium sp.]|jgi:hypothetical protein|nr:hypothetical protein [Mycobacterium sp.]